MEKKTNLFFIILIIIICLFALYYLKINIVYNENFTSEKKTKKIQTKEQDELKAKQKELKKKRDLAVINAPQQSIIKANEKAKKLLENKAKKTK